MEKNWRLDHIAIVVDDVDKAVEFYQSLGIGVAGRVVHDNTKWVNIGPISLQLMEPVKGNLTREAFLGGQTVGLHHICFVVDKVRDEVSKLTEEGKTLVMKKERPIGIGDNKSQDEVRNVHIDVRENGGFTIQLVEKSD